MERLYQSLVLCPSLPQAEDGALHGAWRWLNAPPDVYQRDRGVSVGWRDQYEPDDAPCRDEGSLVAHAARDDDKEAGEEDILHHAGKAMPACAYARLARPILAADATLSRLQVQEIACDPSWTKLAFVRNPYARLLSKFEDKIVRHGKDMKPGGEAYKEFRIPAQRADGLNFTHFTARLAGVAGLTPDVLDGHSHHIRHRQPVMNKPHSESEYVDEHFRVMSNFCGMRYIPYEWIRYEDLAPGMNRIASQMGVSQHPDVAQQIAKFRPRSTCDEALRLGRSYSEVDKTRVREYFAEDFKRFGYSDAFPTCDEPPHPR